MNTAMLRDAFQHLLGPARQLPAQYQPQVRQRDATLDAGQIMTGLRGGTERPA
ncbi:MAG TPA: hypothetical protein PL117_16655 [Accumulibacter sp.]|uniref:hypothetical protein n=1 Tax=Accumulibacter sp. TaxID=2053492 RepID=UPI002D1A63B8|nr:hypothetical protein [Accumulibacter sp.]HRF74397.1 hypothetical protein [Accumulibacter sp.]